MSENKTLHYDLNKPTYDEFGDIEDLNENADLIDEELFKRAKRVTSPTNGNFAALNTDGDLVDSGKKAADFGSAVDVANKVDKVAGKGLSTNDYTTTEKNKLAGLSNYNDTEVRGLITANESAITTLANKSVVGTEGVHGLRYNNDKLQVWTGAGWEDTKSGAQIPLADCTNVAMIVGNTQLTIKWNDPNDLEISGAKVAEWANTKLVRKIGSFPANETDGTLVVTSSVRNQYASTGYTDTGLTNGTTYYYKLFPVSKDGAVTMGSGNNITGTPQSYKTFGVSIDLTNSNPLTAVTYTDDAVGMTAGSSAWESQPIFKDIKPCLLKNGVVQYYLNPNDFTKKADGSAADITSGNDGDVMIEFPKTGFQINTVSNTLTVKITDDPAKAGFKYYAHSRVTEGDRNKLYIGAYKGWNDGNNKLRSLSGKAPYANQTIGTFRTRAQANGAGYDQFAFYPMTLIQCLFIIRFKNLDSQTALGRGYVDGNSAAINTGGTNTKSMFYGETGGKLQMKCFGIEDLWGNVFDWIDGLFSNANRNILTAFQGFNDTGSGYTDHGQGATANIGNYMSKPQGTSERGFIAKEVAGSATTYFSDYAHLNAGFLPIFGGDWYDASNAGVFRLNVYYSASSAYANVGGRLMYL